MQTGGILVVTDRGYGATNFIAMDRNGEMLGDRYFQVDFKTAVDQANSLSNQARRQRRCGR